MTKEIGSNMINMIINSEAFLIVISGVVIFTLQNLISQLWILPLVEFKKCLAKIETLLTRYAFLCNFKYNSNGGLMDAEIEYFRKELKNLVAEMLGTYNILPGFERWWFKKIKKINILKAKTEILTLSAVVSTKNDVAKERPRAEIAIENIPKYLNFTEIKYKMADILGN
ncbi:MAG: hypothetical protein NUV83_03250 [Candidatus Wolfebacteria bacterium]|nr:hypothetical protein [Candidatus Wolfebacteria bacterium]